jgi:hypothetical protein
MIELVVLYFAGRHIASIADTKNRSGVGYVCLMVAAAFAGVALGCLGGVIVGQLIDPDSEDVLPVIIGFYLGMLTGIGVGYLVVCLTPTRRDGVEYDDYQMEEWSLQQ